MGSELTDTSEILELKQTSPGKKVNSLGVKKKPLNKRNGKKGKDNTTEPLPMTSPCAECCVQCWFLQFSDGRAEKKYKEWHRNDQDMELHPHK